MAKLVVLYKKPADAAAFDNYYFKTHVPLANKIPGLLSYQVSSGAVASPTGVSPYHLVATLEFESMSALQQALASPEGGAAAGDLANFAQAGVEMLMFDTKDV
ncbi:MAG: EthD family reductase [Burkholderiaceae bacterium]